MLCISDIDMNGRRIRRLDIFKKVPSEVSRGTDLGGLVSLFTAALILFLFCREIANFFSPEYAAEISSDKLFTREEMTYFPCTQNQPRHFVSRLPLRNHFPRP